MVEVQKSKLYRGSIDTAPNMAFDDNASTASTVIPGRAEQLMNVDAHKDELTTHERNPGQFNKKDYHKFHRVLPWRLRKVAKKPHPTKTALLDEGFDADIADRAHEIGGFDLERARLWAVHLTHTRDGEEHDARNCALCVRGQDPQSRRETKVNRPISKDGWDTFMDHQWIGFGRS